MSCCCWGGNERARIRFCAASPVMEIKPYPGAGGSAWMTIDVFDDELLACAAVLTGIAERPRLLIRDAVELPARIETDGSSPLRSRQRSAAGG